MLDCVGDTRAGALGTGGPGAQPPGRLSEHRACIVQDAWRPAPLLGIRNAASGHCGMQFTDELFLPMTRTAFWPAWTLSLDGQIMEATQWVGFNCELKKES